NRPEIDAGRLEEVIKQDVSLSLRLLRYLNASRFGWREPVTSVQRAVLLLGARTIRRLASLLALTTLGEDKPSELVATCLVRARACEGLAPLSVRLAPCALDLFFVGLLSLVDALLDRPLSAVLADLAVSPAIASALEARTAPLGTALALIEDWERADWAGVARHAAALGLPDAALPKVFADALAWARAALAT